MGKSYEKYLDKDSVSTKASAPKREVPKDVPSYLKYLSDAEEEVQNRNDSIVKDAATLGVHGATLGFSDEIAGALGPNYEKSRDEHRKRIEQAREHLPYIGPVIEGVGSAATTYAIPPLRAGKAITEIPLALLQAYGENTDPERLDEDLLWSGGISSAANAGGKLVKKVFSQPENILANSAGARGINYRKGEAFIGEDSAEEFADKLKDPAGLAARLDKLGFFGMGKKTFKNGKYVREGLMSSLETPTVEGLMERSLKGLDVLKQKNVALLKGKQIPVAKIKAALQTAANEFIPAGEDYLQREIVAQQLAETGFQDLVMSGALKPGAQTVDAADVEKVLKTHWQKKVASSYDSGKALSDITNEGVAARRKFATAIDKLVDSYGGPEYAANNDTMRDLLTVKNLVHEKSSRQRGYSGGGPRLTNMKQLWHSLLENTVYSHPADLARARIGQGLRTEPGQAAANALNRIPVEWYNSNMVDQTPEQATPMRSPQSVPNIPEQFIRTPLPRNTQKLMEQKNFVLGKVAQMMPDMFESVKDTYDHEPERIGEVAQVLAMKMPQLFERDKYNRFDGRILDEKDKQSAIKDTLLRQDISPIEQAKIITKLNKEGLYDG